MKTKTNAIRLGATLLSLTILTIQGVSQNSFPVPNGNAHVNSLGITGQIYKLNINSGSLNGGGGADQVGIGGTNPLFCLYNGNVSPSSSFPFNLTNNYAKFALASGPGAFLANAQQGDLIIQNVTQNRSILFSSNFTGGNGVEHMRLDFNGNLGLGAAPPTFIRLYVNKDANPAGTNQYATLSKITQVNPVTGGGSYLPFVGVEGNASTNYVGQSEMIGVSGIGTNGAWSYGGYFVGNSPYSCDGSTSYGVKAIANGAEYNYGLFAESNNACRTGYAGYFNGDVVRTGWDNFTSDMKLKTEIKPLANTMETLMKLKPTTYKFRTNEFKTLHLPQGEQMGLIAQDLEKVIPELVTTIPPSYETDEKGNKVEHTPEFKAVRYVSLIPLLIGGVQEQQQVINKQQQQIDELKAQIMLLLNNGKSGKVGTTAVPVNLTDKNIVVLDQNVPNPFAESTVISYNVPENFTKAQIQFTNQEGKIIKAVDILSAGPGSMSIFANDLSNGVYTYSLVVDGNVMATKKMIKE